MTTTTRLGVDIAIRRQAALSERIARGQSDISLNKRIQVASDDPAAAIRINKLKSDQVANASWIANADYGAAVAQNASTGLSSVSTILDRARELTLNSATVTTSPGDRQSIATELKALADEIDQISNTTDSQSQRVFPDGATILLPIGDLTRISPTLTKDEAFKVSIGGNNRDIATILRTAAAAAETGTDADRSAAVSDVTAASEHMSAMNGLIGLRAYQVEQAQGRLTDSKTDIAAEISSLGDTDVPATITRIQADQLALDASRSLYAKTNSRTLFDLLG